MTLYKVQVQVDQEPQHKTIYTNLIGEKVGNRIKDIGMGNLHEQSINGSGSKIKN